MSTALRYYGLIPETVYETQSVTIKHARAFDTPYGRFSYTSISREAFHIGVRSISNGEFAFMIATPEKALCDLVANTPHVNLRFVKDASIYLEEDLRLDIDRFAKMNLDIFTAYTAVGKKCDSIRTLLK